MSDINDDMLEALGKIVHFQREQADRLQAYIGVIHSMIATHPNLEEALEDYKRRMGGFSDTTTPERFAEINVHRQLIVDAMTAELAQRKKGDTV